MGALGSEGRRGGLTAFPSPWDQPVLGRGCEAAIPPHRLRRDLVLGRPCPLDAWGGNELPRAKQMLSPELGSSAREASAPSPLCGRTLAAQVTAHVRALRPLTGSHTPSTWPGRLRPHLAPLDAHGSFRQVLASPGGEPRR